MRRSFASASFAVAVTGCTLLTNVDGLSSGGPLPGDAGGAIAPDGSVRGVDVDGAAILPDGGKPMLDSGSAVDGSSFCNSRPGLSACFDFENGQSIAAYPQFEQGSTLTIDAPGSGSNNALHCVAADGKTAECGFEYPIATKPTRVGWTFDVRLDEAGDDTEFDDIEFGGCQIQPTMSAGVLQVNEYMPNQGAPDQVNHDIGPVATASSAGWYTFAIAVDFSARTLKVQIQKPDGTALTPAPITLDPRCNPSDSGVFHVGLSYAAARTPGTNIRTDNLTLTLQ